MQILPVVFSLNLAYTQTACHNIVSPHFCLSLSVPPSLRPPSLPPSPPPFFLRLCRLLISNSAWSAGCRQTGVEREDAVFVCRCLPLLPSKWKRPVGSSVCVYLSLSEGRNKAWKCCPQAVCVCVCVCVCVFGWRSGSDRSSRSNIVYGSPSSQVRSGLSLKNKSAVGFFSIWSETLRARASGSVFDKRRTRRQTYGDKKPGDGGQTDERQREEGREGETAREEKGGREGDVSVCREERGVWRHWGLFLKSAFFRVYQSFAASYSPRIRPSVVIVGTKTLQRFLSLPSIAAFRCNPVPFNFPNPVTHECPLSCNIIINKI